MREICLTLLQPRGSNFTTLSIDTSKFLHKSASEKPVSPILYDCVTPALNSNNVESRIEATVSAALVVSLMETGALLLGSMMKYKPCLTMTIWGPEPKIPKKRRMSQKKLFVSSSSRLSNILSARNVVKEYVLANTEERRP
jgi:hypothetical protein